MKDPIAYDLFKLANELQRFANLFNHLSAIGQEAGLPDWESLPLRAEGSAGSRRTGLTSIMQVRREGYVLTCRLDARSLAPSVLTVRLNRDGPNAPPESFLVGLGFAHMSEEFVVGFELNGDQKFLEKYWGVLFLTHEDSINYSRGLDIYERLVRLFLTLSAPTPVPA